MNSESSPLPTPPSSVSRIFDVMSILLMGAILMAISLAIGLIWATTLPATQTIRQRFVPADSGITLNYRVTAPDSTTRYQSSNVAQVRGNDALNLVDVNARAEIIARFTGIPFSDMSEAQMRSFLTDEVGRVRVAQVVETTYSLTETISTVENLFLVQNRSIELLAVDGQAFTPAIPFYNDALALEASITTEGTFGFNSPYSATLTFEAIEAIETPLRTFEGCQRWFLLVEIPDISYRQLRSWFCEGIGVVAQEIGYDRTNSVTRLDLVAARSPALNQSVDVPPLLPAPPTAPPPVFPVDIAPDQWETVWSFRTQGVEADISTEVVPFNDLYIYGNEGGSLLAVNREHHTLAWRFQTGDSLFTKPIIVNGMVYSAGANRTLYTLDAQNGTFRWAFTAGDLLSASPAIADGIVYIGAENGTLYALNAQTGMEVWQYQTAGPIAAPPVVHEGVVYVGSDDGGLYALDINTKEPRWIFPSDAGIMAGVAIENNTVFVGNVDGWIYALNPDTTRSQGEVIWAFEAEDAVEATLKVAEGQVYIALLNDIQILDAATGEEQWRYHTDQNIRDAPLKIGTYLFVNTPRTIVVLDAKNGSVVGSIPTGSPESFTPLATDGENLLVGHGDGYLRVMSTTPIHPWQGREQWVATTLTNRLFALEDDLGSPPVVNGEDLLFVTTNGRVFRVNRMTGDTTLLGETKLDLAYLPPMVADDTLITGNFFGELKAFDLSTNRVKWQIDLNTSAFTSAYIANQQVVWAATVENELVAYGFDLNTGETVWQQALPYALAAAPSALLYQGTFYVVGDSLTAMNPATGEVLWQSVEPFRPLFLTATGNTVYAMSITDDFSSFVVGWDVNSHKATAIIPYAPTNLPSIYGGMASANGKVVLAADEGEITLIDGETRSVVWQTTNGTGILGSPLVRENEVLYITKDNHLHARRMEDGELIGDFTLQAVNAYSSQGTMTPVLVDETLYAGFYQNVFALPLRK